MVFGCGGQIRTADAPGLWDRCGDRPPRGILFIVKKALPDV